MYSYWRAPNNFERMHAQLDVLRHCKAMHLTRLHQQAADLRRIISNTSVLYPTLSSSNSLH